MVKEKKAKKEYRSDRDDPLSGAARRVTQRCEVQARDLRSREAHFVEQAARKSLNFLITR